MPQKRKIDLKQINHLGVIIDNNNIGATSSLSDGGLTVDFDGVHTAYTAAIAVVQADVDQNEADADAAIAALQADVDQNEADADSAIAALQADVDQNEADADAAIAAEETRAIGAEGGLQAQINSNDTDIAGLQTELDDTQTGAGLHTDGTYPAVNISGRDYISGATSLDNADLLLSIALKAEETARIADIASTVASEMSFRGDLDATSNTPFSSFGAIAKGDMWVVTTGGAKLDENLEAGDMVIAKVASAQLGQTPKQFSYVQKNFDLASYATVVALNAVQADVDQNEADADAAIAALQADVDQNEADADSAIATLQADVDQNEADADSAIAALQADVDQNEADADAAIAAEALARSTQDDVIEASCGLETGGSLSWGTAPEHSLISSTASLKLGALALCEEIDALMSSGQSENRAMNFYGEGVITTDHETNSKVQLVFGGNSALGHTNSDTPAKKALNIQGKKTLNSFHYWDQTLNNGAGGYFINAGKIQLYLNGVLLQQGNLVDDDYRLIGDNTDANIPAAERVSGHDYTAGITSSNTIQQSYFYIEFPDALIEKGDVITVYASFSDML